MEEAFIGSIVLFAGNFAPRGWAFCNGQLLAIQQYSAVFSILGTTYGGNGTTNFALPDLRGRVPAHAGTGPGLTEIDLGEPLGTNNNTLLISNLPPHNHLLNANAGTTGRDLKALPTTNYPAQNQDATGNFAATTDVQMNPAAIGTTGTGIPVNNMQPTLGLNYIICLQGVFPSRN
jgi:microcystin-dependent protein